jgi:hypothetical protein
MVEPAPASPCRQPVACEAAGQETEQLGQQEGLSRTAQKKALRHAARARRLKEKRARRRTRPEKVPAGAPNGWGAQAVAQRVGEKQRRRRAREAMRWQGGAQGSGAHRGLRVIIEMGGFGELMAPSEVRSLAQQVHRCYSINLQLGKGGHSATGAGPEPEPEPELGLEQRVEAAATEGTASSSAAESASPWPPLHGARPAPSSSSPPPPPPPAPAGHARMALGSCVGPVAEALRRISGWQSWGLEGLLGADDDDGGLGVSVAQLLALASEEQEQEAGRLGPRRRRVVMLSPDAEEALDGVHAGDVFLIGGLCDARRIVGASLRRAAEIGSTLAESSSAAAAASSAGIEVIHARRLPLAEWAWALADDDLAAAEGKQCVDGGLTTTTASASPSSPPSSPPSGSRTEKAAVVGVHGASTGSFVDILTVDQVFAILLSLANNSNNWREALRACLPLRKRRLAARARRREGPTS